LAGGAEAPASAEGVDKEVAQAGLLLGDGAEARVVAMLLAEIGPVLEDDGAGVASLGDPGLLGSVQRSAEISAELISGLSVSSVQGCGNG
jgi:hypothetical protein